MRFDVRPAWCLLVRAAAVITLVLLPSAGRRGPVELPDHDTHVTVAGPEGAAPRLAFAPFTAVSRAPALDQTAAALRGVLEADLSFEGVFEVLDGPVQGSHAPAADGMVSGVLELDGGFIHLEVRIRSLRGGRLAFAREYVGPEPSARLIAHVAADEILADQAGVRGLAHSRLAFVSDRAGGYTEPTGSRRRVKEIFVADYDGANDSRVTSDGELDLTPSWSPDRLAVAYTCYRRGYQDIFITRLGPRRQDTPTGGRGRNWLPAWSPDGTRIAFTSDREGSEDIYVIKADGSDLRRLTSHWAIDTSPAWSPDGTEIAFTSNRTGRPQIWVMRADGSGQRALTSDRYCDRPSWSPGPADEIAYASLTKTGFDIMVIDRQTGSVRQLTSGGQNESPSFSPNGRHIAFTSVRSGSQQIWTMTRTGTDLRQVTHVGNNSMAAWSQ
jgi:TolB protein